jgi:hypothetical protein
MSAPHLVLLVIAAGCVLLHFLAGPGTQVRE